MDRGPKVPSLGLSRTRQSQCFVVEERDLRSEVSKLCWKAVLEGHAGLRHKFPHMNCHSLSPTHHEQKTTIAMKCAR